MDVRVTIKKLRRMIREALSTMGTDAGQDRYPNPIAGTSLKTLHKQQGVDEADERDINAPEDPRDPVNPTLRYPKGPNSREDAQDRPLSKKH